MDEKPITKKMGVNGGKPSLPIEAPQIDEVDLTAIENDIPSEKPLYDDAPEQYRGDVSIDEILSEQAEVDPVASVKKKKQNKIVFGGVAAGVVVMLILFMMAGGGKPGPQTYGLCSVWLEMNTPYPHTLKYTGIEGSATAIRIYYNHIDPFGEQKNEMIECTFAPDEKQGMKVIKIQRNRRAIDVEEVRKFNKLLPVVAKTEMNLVMPPDWKNPLIKD
jgi:hypothetical protein